jgi:subtilisin-like proprotein convertase family protein/uncharacterized protein YvpB
MEKQLIIPASKTIKIQGVWLALYLAFAGLLLLTNNVHAERDQPTQDKPAYPANLNTPTNTTQLMSTAIPTDTPLPTATITEITPNTSMIFGPLIVNHWSAAPIEIEDFLICNSLGSPLAIPDNDPSGIEDKIVVTNDSLIVDVEIYLNVDHTWVGDLEISLGLDGTRYETILIDRPGIPSSSNGCSMDNLRTILDDQASQPAEMKCLSYPAAISGIYQSSSSMDIFRGVSAAGTWTLNLSDVSTADTGKLNKWCLHFSLSEYLPLPTPTPTPVDIPESARITGISGEDQALPLDCESRSAVDWANYFGTHISEFEFLSSLPVSDNPDLGFVGDVNGTWGQIPPDDYGVHAEPVADLLNEYGLTAIARKSLTWDELRAEIAASRPVIAWVIGSVVNGAPVYYKSESYPKTSIVAHYEHTVIVIGYTADSVIILDGDNIYTRPLNLFLESWSALNNMAVLAQAP